MTELSRLRGSEEYDTCGDAVPPRTPKKTLIVMQSESFLAKSVLADGINPPSVDEIIS